jgi:hypothetical protein
LRCALFTRRVNWISAGRAAPFWWIPVGLRLSWDLGEFDAELFASSGRRKDGLHGRMTGGTVRSRPMG